MTPFPAGKVITADSALENEFWSYNMSFVADKNKEKTILFEAISKKKFLVEYAGQLVGEKEVTRRSLSER